jgi:hypothetical protein
MTIPFLREQIKTITFHSEPSDVMAMLSAKLKKFHVDVERDEPAKGEIVARCLAVCFNMLIWRCWSDRLLFKVTKSGAHDTKVDVYTIPNLFRIRVRADETVVDVQKLVAKLVDLP